ncbi:MAG TPA: PAS domain-containing protein [Candidatus Eisenbacteria bacterium]|nr:PAS domain-containing protein [Candidatus Eisenbacteria bacterium]
MAHRPSIATRLTLTLLGFTGLGMAVTGFYIAHIIEKHAVRDLKAELETHARLIQDDVAPLLGSVDSIRRIQELANHYRVTLGARVTIIGLDGRVLGESELDASGVMAMENHAARPEIRSALAGKVGSEVRLSETLGVDMLYVAIPIQSRERVEGALRLAVAMPEVTRTIVWVRGSVIVSALLAFALAVGTGVFVGQRIIRPVREMRAVAHEIADGKLERVFPVRGAEEVAEMGAAMNRMALALRGKMESVRVEKENLAAVLDSMAQGVIAVDGESRVLFVNPAARGMFGLAEAPVNGQPLLTVIPETALYDLLQEAQSRPAGECYRRNLHIAQPTSRVLDAYAVALTSASQRKGTLLVLTARECALAHEQS